MSTGRRGGELDHPRVDERRAHLEGAGHGHAVAHHQVVIRHADHQVRVEHPVGQRLDVGRIEIPQHLAEGVRVRERLRDGGVEQLGALLGREAQHAQRLRVALAALHLGHRLQPCQPLGEALVAEGLRHRSDDARHDLATQDRGQHAVVVHQALPRIAVVAGEGLVAAVAREHHLDVPGSEP
jgi:hypothetical protein